jgi:hypothetical protein
MSVLSILFRLRLAAVDASQHTPDIQGYGATSVLLEWQFGPQPSRLLFNHPILCPTKIVLDIGTE